MLLVYNYRKRGTGIAFKIVNFVLIMVIIVVLLNICYISSGATNIAEVSSGFHQADWSNTLIVHCYLISFLFCFICLLFLLVSRTQLDCAHMQTSGQFKFALYITND